MALAGPGCENQNRESRAQQATLGSGDQRRHGTDTLCLATAVSPGSDRHGSCLLTGHRSNLSATESDNPLLAVYDIDRACLPVSKTGMNAQVHDRGGLVQGDVAMEVGYLYHEGRVGNAMGIGRP